MKWNFGQHQKFLAEKNTPSVTNKYKTKHIGRYSFGAFFLYVHINHRTNSVGIFEQVFDNSLVFFLLLTIMIPLQNSSLISDKIDISSFLIDRLSRKKTDEILR